MDQVKIGKFISQKRKEQNLTQMQLAEKLGITDRAVSKWERGKSFPDAAIILDLCEILKISVSDLLSGESVPIENYNEKIEHNLVDIVKQKEQSDKRLLSAEIMLSVISITFLAVLFAIGIVFIKTSFSIWCGIVLMVFGVLQFLVAMLFCIKIEQVAGYYECQNCGHKYVPTFGAVNRAMHLGRTRYLKCPKCGKKSWQKKVINKI